MHRFFVQPESLHGGRVALSGSQAHQIARVLRMRPGDRLVVLDNSGWEIETRLVSVDPNLVTGDVLRRRLSASEPRTKISLYQGVLKRNRLEFALQKGTELGIVEFVPVIAERCVMADLAAVEKKRRRWERIIQEAAEQSGRGRMPKLRAATLFPQVCEHARHSGGLSLILWEGESQVSLRNLLQQQSSSADGGGRLFSVNLLVGPEGGFSGEEVSIARRYGVQPVTLGSRVLRGETAGIVAAAIILYEMGDMQ